MSGIEREALEYLVNLGVKSDPIVLVGGKPYSVEQLYPVKEIGPKPLKLNFLDSFLANEPSAPRVDDHGLPVGGRPGAIR